MNVVAMYYDLKVSYKDDLISNIMNFNENVINRNEKVEKNRRVNIQNDLYLDDQKP